MAISSKPTSRYRILAARFNEVSQFPDIARATNAARASTQGKSVTFGVTRGCIAVVSPVSSITWLIAP